MDPLFFLFLAFIAFCALVVSAGAVKKKEADSAWRQAARKLGLSPTACKAKPFGGRSMRGKVEGHGVKVETFTRGHGQNSTTYTRYRVAYPPLRLGLKLTKQRALHGVGKAFGMQDIEVGLEKFDSGFLIQGRNPDRIREFLDSERRMRLSRARRGFGELKVTDSAVTGVRGGVERRPTLLAATVRQLVKLAQALSVEHSEEEPMARALAARSEGDLGAAVASLDEARSESEPDPDAEVTSAEILFTLGEHARTRAALEEVAPELHEEDDASALLEEARRRELNTSGPEPASEAEPAAPEAEPPQDGEPAAQEEPAADLQLQVPEPHTDADGAAQLLFGDGELGFRITERFEAELQGRFARWSGELVRVRSFYSDLVFGSEPGTRAKLRIAEVGGREVHVVLGLPPEAEEALKSRVGESLSFEGWLVRCDAYMRNLFVAEARLGD